MSDDYKIVADYWEDRYRTQHKTVHRLEDEIARLREGATALYERIRAGIDWGRSGPWPPDAASALDELLALVTPNGTSVAADSDDPKNGGSKPEER